MRKEYAYRWQWRLSSLWDQLWPKVAETDPFNRDAGLPNVPRAQAEDLSNARCRLSFSRLGILVEWEEAPFQWVENQGFGVVRSCRRGPID